MSSHDQTFWMGFLLGLLLCAVSIWLWWRSSWRSADKRKIAAQSALGDAIFSLGLVFFAAAPSIRSIGAWSTDEKVTGACVLLFLILAGIKLGIAIERWRQRKPGAGDAHRVDSVGLS